jgi:hypothetical protein
MGIAIGALIVICIVVFVVWTFRQDIPETTMGKENRLRREAKKAQKRGVHDEDLGDRG